MNGTELPWAEGASVQGIQFVDAAAGASLVAVLPPPIGRVAVLAPAGAAADLQLVVIQTDDFHRDSRMVEIANWLQPTDPLAHHVVTMHGAQVHWCLPRIVIESPADRAEAVMRAVVEVAYLEQELRSIESESARQWPEVQADAPMAFEFLERFMRHRRRLSQRFVQVLGLRSRLTRIMPRVLAPAIYPPTLAGQVQERLRERLGMAHRIESVSTQIEVFEQVYEGCSHRISEYVQTRKGLMLEWIIIILLAAQLVLYIVESMSGAGK